MEATVHPSLVWLQVPEPSQKEDAGAAQSLLPALLSSQPLKSGATTAIRLGQAQGWPMSHPGLGRAEEGESTEPGRGAHGDGRWQVQVSRDEDFFWSRCPQGSYITAEMGTMQLESITALPHILSHPAMASHRHSSSHGVLSPAIWLDDTIPIPPHARVAPSGTDVTAGPGPTGLVPVQTKDTGTPQPWGVQGHRLTQAVPWAAPNQQLPAAAREQSAHLAGGPWGRGPCPAPQHPVGPGPHSALPRAEPILMGAQTWENPSSAQIQAQLGCATSCHHDLGWTGRRCH